MKDLLTELLTLSTKIAPTIDPHTLDPALTFAEAGLDSLDTFAFFMKIEEKYGLTIPEVDFNAIKTFEDLLSYANHRLPKHVP